jgi:imidazolonepropionase-like amidohydrolase
VGATVVDVAGGTTIRDATVLVEGGRIAAVGPGATVPVPAGARVVDGAGAWLIPGLWDMHAHTTYATPAEVERAFFPALVAHGVLGIRDPASRFPAEQTRRWRAAIAEGRLVGPRLAGLGRVVDARPTTLGTLLARDAAEAQRAAESIRRDGYDFAKPYNDLSPAAYRALAAAARGAGLGLAGHLPYSVDAGDASDAGQRSVEHLTNLWYEVSSAEDAIRARILAGLAAGESPEALFRAKIDTLFPLTFRTYDPARERELFGRFVRNGTWQVPTLVVDRHLAHSAGTAASDPAHRLLPRWVRNSGDALDRFLAGLAPAQRATLAELYQREGAMVGRMQRAGVGLLAGSDAPLARVAPGAGLHDELEALVRDAGLTPLEALRAATLNPGLYLGAADSIGTVAPGRAADLVLLDADPTADIRNVRRIRAVIARGRYLDRAALDALLAGAERAASASR